MSTCNNILQRINMGYLRFSFRYAEDDRGSDKELQITGIDECNGKFLKLLNIPDKSMHNRTNLKYINDQILRDVIKPVFLNVLDMETVLADLVQDTVLGERTVDCVRKFEAFRAVFRCRTFLLDATSAVVLIDVERSINSQKIKENRDRSRNIYVRSDEDSLFDVGPVMVIRWSAEEGFPVKYATANAESIIGYSKHELVEKDFRYSEYIHPDDIYRVSDEIARHLSEKNPHFEQVYRIRHKDGHYLWVRDYSMPEWDGDRVDFIMGSYMILRLKKNSKRSSLSKINDMATYSKRQMQVPGNGISSQAKRSSMSAGPRLSVINCLNWVS